MADAETGDTGVGEAEATWEPEVDLEPREQLASLLEGDEYFEPGLERDMSVNFREHDILRDGEQLRQVRDGSEIAFLERVEDIAASLRAEALAQGHDKRAYTSMGVVQAVIRNRSVRDNWEVVPVVEFKREPDGRNIIVTTKVPTELPRLARSAVIHLGRSYERELPAISPGPMYVIVPGKKP